jgi:RNA polymerase sigma-70 factor (ECF subfamily)
MGLAAQRRRGCRPRGPSQAPDRDEKTFDYDRARSFRAWLKTVAQNAWHDFGKSHWRELTQDPDRFQAILDARAALDDLRSRIEDAHDRELLELAMRRVEKRVKPANWRAFQVTAIEGRTGADAAKDLGMPVARVFIGKHRVERMLEEGIRILMGEPA